MAAGTMLEHTGRFMKYPDELASIFECLGVFWNILEPIHQNTL